MRPLEFLKSFRLKKLRDAGRLGHPNPPLACTLQWSIPRRRLGERSLSTIPEDVYRIIFDYIQPSEDISVREHKDLISNLALVCRFFLVSFVPLLFRSMNLSGSKGMEFYTSLVGNREPAHSLGVFIKHCSFKGEAFLAPRYPSEGLRLLHGIESLFLTRFSFNTDLFDAIGGLSNLNSLSITGFTTDFNMSFPPNVFLKLTSFTLLNPFSRLSNHLGESLLAFIGVATLRVLETDDGGFLWALTNCSRDLRIEELNVSYGRMRDLQPLYNAFPRMPYITTLSLSVYYPSFDATLSLSPFSLLNLQILTCPTFLAAQLIPGRPLEHIHLTPNLSSQSYEDVFGVPIAESQRLFSVLKKSIAPIEFLNIPIDIYFASSFHEALPHLKTLYLRYPNPSMGISSTDHFKEKVIAIGRRRQPLPSITNLRLDFATSVRNSRWIWKFTLQSQMARVLHRVAFPTLKRVSFIDGLEWVLQENNDDTWQPRVSKKLRQELEQLLAQLPNLLLDPSDDILNTLFPIQGSRNSAPLLTSVHGILGPK